jgi:hypothetical protein
MLIKVCEVSSSLKRKISGILGASRDSQISNILSLSLQIASPIDFDWDCEQIHEHEPSFRRVRVVLCEVNWHPAFPEKAIPVKYLRAISRSSGIILIRTK